MNTTHSSLKQRGALGWLGALLLAMNLELGHAGAADPVSFRLYLKNGASATVSFTIIPGVCYQGTPASGTLACLGGEDAAVLDWQIKRDGTSRGIVEVTRHD